jgi:hypothetical protein
MKKSILTLVVLFLAAASLNAQKLKAEDLIAKHLDSIAPAEKRSSIKSLIAVGEVRVDYKTQKNQPASGRIVIASEGPKMFFGMQLNATDYAQEKIIFDGSKTDVGYVRTGGRSLLGNFVQSNNGIVSQGLMTGTLTTSWALLDVAGRGGKLSSPGSKKIDGKDVYSISFNPKGSSDVDVTLYFDAQTFQHVRTEYKRTSSASMGRTPEESSRMQETRLKVTEDFSDFKAEQGMNVPHKYTINYLISGQNGTTEIEWTANLSEFAINQALDPATFAIGK